MDKQKILFYIRHHCHIISKFLLLLHTLIYATYSFFQLQKEDVCQSQWVKMTNRQQIKLSVFCSKLKFCEKVFTAAADSSKTYPQTCLTYFLSNLVQYSIAVQE